MPRPVIFRVDEETRERLRAEARERHINLSTLLREIFTDAAQEVQRRQISSVVKPPEQ
jgi:hypothetical protein